MDMTDYIYDTITADQIEDGDQIIVDGEALENVRVSADPDDIDAVIVTGWSEDTGDDVTHTLPYDYTVSLWSL